MEKKEPTEVRVTNRGPIRINDTFEKKLPLNESVIIHNDKDNNVVITNDSDDD